MWEFVIKAVLDSETIGGFPLPLMAATPPPPTHPAEREIAA